MAKTETIEVPDELKLLQRQALEQSDRFLLSVVQGHKSLPSDARRKLIREQSLFGFLSPLWQALTTEEKDVWKSAGNYSSLTNWQLFISDNAARIRADLTLDIPPSDLWQVRAGHITIEAPASEIILKQSHPQKYWIAQKVVGASWKKNLVYIEEIFGFPLEIGIRYKSNLVATGPTQSARYYASVRSSYQGVDRFTLAEVNFVPINDWTLVTATISGVIGHVIGYTLYIEIIGYTGELLFDNIRATHGGTNWALDPRCDEIDKTFSKAFAVVPPFWLADSLPSGSTFVSDYPPAL